MTDKVLRNILIAALFLIVFLMTMHSVVFIFVFILLIAVLLIAMYNDIL